MDVLPLSFFSTPRLVLVLSSNFFCSYTNFTEQTLYVYIHSYIIVVSIVTPWTVVRQASLSFIVSEFAQTHVHPTISSSVIPVSFSLQSSGSSILTMVIETTKPLIGIDNKENCLAGTGNPCWVFMLPILSAIGLK